MKAYTDFEQSKKLAEILSVETADMIYPNDFDFPFLWIEKPEKDKNSTPCWSLMALLSILDFPCLTQENENKWEVCVPDHANGGYIEETASNPVDACFAMILKLKERNLI